MCLQMLFNVMMYLLMVLICLQIMLNVDDVLMCLQMVFNVMMYLLMVLICLQIMLNVDDVLMCLQMVLNQICQLGGNKTFRLLVPLLIFTGLQQGFMFADFNQVNTHTPVNTCTQLYTPAHTYIHKHTYRTCTHLNASIHTCTLYTHAHTYNGYKM